jgi:hypothetical protein
MPIPAGIANCFNKMRVLFSEIPYLILCSGFLVTTIRNPCRPTEERYDAVEIARFIGARDVRGK